MKINSKITKQPNAPINVFIHGGAWRSGNAKRAAYMSETVVDAEARISFRSISIMSPTSMASPDRSLAGEVKCCAPSP